MPDRLDQHESHMISGSACATDESLYPGGAHRHADILVLYDISDIHLLLARQ